MKRRAIESDPEEVDRGQAIQGLICQLTDMDLYSRSNKKALRGKWWVKSNKKSEKAGLKLNIQKLKFMAPGPITSWQIDGETMETVTDFIFLDSKITADDDCSREIKDTSSWKKSHDQTRQHIKKQSHYFSDKSLSSQSSGFVWMWELDHKESWVLKNWCFWTVVLEKTLESPLGCEEIKSVHPKWNQS